MNSRSLPTKSSLMILSLTGLMSLWVSLFRSAWAGVEISPENPTANDSVSVRVTGVLPDCNWEFRGHEVERVGSRFEVRTLFFREEGGTCGGRGGRYSYVVELGQLAPGEYAVSVTRASDTLEVTFVVQPLFIRGDCNDDGNVDISDAVCTLAWLFLDGEAPCRAANNMNGDGATDISDAVYLLNYLFLGGPAPVAPFAACGPGLLSADEITGCEAAPATCN
jgi:hypothetical protein